MARERLTSGRISPSGLLAYLSDSFIPRRLDLGWMTSTVSVNKKFISEALLMRDSRNRRSRSKTRLQLDVTRMVTHVDAHWIVTRRAHDERRRRTRDS